MVAPLSPAAQQHLQALAHLGSLTEADAGDGQLLTSSHGAPGTPEHINLSLVLDGNDQVTAARFTSQATGAQLLAFDTMAALAVGISIKQAAHITPAQVKRKMSSLYKQSECPLPFADDEPFPILTKIANYHAPKPKGNDVIPEGPTFADLGLFEKVRKVEQVLDDHVRPMLAQDGGGIELVDLRGDELVVTYQGACGSCSSSIGGTLKFIEETLNDALQTELIVTPEGLDESAFIM